MRPFETILILANLVAFLILAIPLPGAVSWLRHWAPIVLLIAGLQALGEGRRWQMIPAYALAGLFFVIWLLWVLFPAPLHIPGPAAELTIGLGALVLAVSTALPLLLPVFHFPPPSGPYAVGTLTYHWTDAARPEIFTADPNDHRELMVQIWYPATGDPAPGAPRAPYVPDARAIARAAARLSHLPAFTFAHLKYVTTNATPAAAVASSEPAYPVLILMEGLYGFRQANTFQVEELVSYGYIVAAIDQPYVSGTVVFPDGREVVGLPPDVVRRLFRPSLSPVEQAPVLNGRAFPNGIIHYLAQDALFALDRLAELNRADPNGILIGRMDLERTGLLGVSLGGIVGAEACRLEPRLLACLIMEARMPADVVRDGLNQPTMWITGDVETMQREGWSQADIQEHQGTMRAVFDSLPSAGYFVRVRGMFHIDLTDVPTWIPLLCRLGLSGPIGGQQAHRIINAYSLAFFDRHLKGRQVPLLDRPVNQYAEVLFEARPLADPPSAVPDALFGDEGN